MSPASRSSLCPHKSQAVTFVACCQYDSFSRCILFSSRDMSISSISNKVEKQKRAYQNLEVKMGTPWAAFTTPCMKTCGFIFLIRFKTAFLGLYHYSLLKQVSELKLTIHDKYLIIVNFEIFNLNSVPLFYFCIELKFEH